MHLCVISFVAILVAMQSNNKDLFLTKHQKEVKNTAILGGGQLYVEYNVFVFYLEMTYFEQYWPLGDNFRYQNYGKKIINRDYVVIFLFPFVGYVLLPHMFYPKLLFKQLMYNLQLETYVFPKFKLLRLYKLIIRSSCTFNCKKQSYKFYQ